MEVQEISHTKRIERFDSWPEYIQYAQARGPRPVAELHSQRVEEKRKGRYWSGTATYEEALDLAQRGWRQGVAMADKQSHSIETRLYNLIERPYIEYDVTGEVLDVGRYCSGDPEHWGVFRQELVEGHGTKHVSIVVNGVCSSGIEPSVIMRRGAAVVALVHLLELAGHRTNVKLVFAFQRYDGNYIYEVQVPLKSFSESLDMDKLAYAIAHPSCFRRHGFACAEKTPSHFVEAMGFHVKRGYSRPGETLGEKGDIYIPEMKYGDYRWNDEDTATQWIKDELVRLNVIKPD